MRRTAGLLAKQAANNAADNDLRAGRVCTVREQLTDALTFGCAHKPCVQDNSKTIRSPDLHKRKSTSRYPKITERVFHFFQRSRSETNET